METSNREAEGDQEVQHRKGVKGCHSWALSVLLLRFIGLLEHIGRKSISVSDVHAEKHILMNVTCFEKLYCLLWQGLVFKMRLLPLSSSYGCQKP